MFQTFTGVMARRLLVNWRVPAEIAARVLPGKVRPTLVKGWAIAGLCLVRLERMRPTGLPGILGMASENMAIRMGAEWDTPEGMRRGVIIFRRDTGSWANSVVAGRAGYGVHHRGTFAVEEAAGRTEVSVRGEGDAHRAHVVVRDSARVTAGSLFANIDEAGRFFRGGECGYAQGRRRGVWEGARLRLHRWDLRPMAVDAAYSSYIDVLFGGAAAVDSAFVMRGIGHTWQACGTEPFGAVGACGVGGRVDGLAA